MNRWISIDQASLGTRLVVGDDSSGAPAGHQIQHQELFGASFFLDEKAKYSVHAGLGDGDNFAGGWSNTGIGPGAASYRMYLKKLYFSAKPVEGIEFQYGGIGIERGVSTPITSYADPGYLTGGRILVHHPKALFFDTVSFTKAYLGDLDSPNMGRRFHRLQQSNYQQYLVEKRLSGRVSASLDYTNQWGIKTLRESIRLGVKESKVLDAVQFDSYQRTNRDRKTGFNFGLEKEVTRRLSLVGGYAAIDRNYGDLNDDAFFHGNRVYAGAQIHITPDFAVSALINRTAGEDYAVPNRTHFHLAFNYDLLRAFKRAGFVKRSGI